MESIYTQKGMPILEVTDIGQTDGNPGAIDLSKIFMPVDGDEIHVRLGGAGGADFPVDAFETDAAVADAINAGKMYPVDDEGRRIGTATASIDPETGAVYVRMEILRKSEFESVKQSKLIQTEFVYSATSKVSRRQADIAKCGAAGAEVSVGGGVSIPVAITRADGSPLVLSEKAKQLQDVIAGMVIENGLPLYVSTQQIFRRFTGKSYDAPVTEKEAEEIDVLMRYLTDTIVCVDFSRQVEQHKKLRERADEIGSPKYRGPLIYGVYLENFKTVNGNESAGYHISMMPILSQYSLSVFQVMRYPLALLQSSATQKTGHIKRGSNTLREMSIRRFLLDEINAAVQAAKKRKDNKIRCAICIDNVIEKCDIGSSPKLRETTRNLIERILEGWRKDKNPIIASWTATFKGKKITGYQLDIIFPNAQWPAKIKA